MKKDISSEPEERDKLLWQKKIEHSNKIARAVESVRNGMTYRQARIKYGLSESTISRNCKERNVSSKRKPVNSNKVRHIIVKAMIDRGLTIDEMFETVAAAENNNIAYNTFYNWLVQNNYISKIDNRKYRDTSNN